jgi:hypothetical protein
VTQLFYLIIFTKIKTQLCFFQIFPEQENPILTDNSLPQLQQKTRSYESFGTLAGKERPTEAPLWA